MIPEQGEIEVLVTVKAAPQPSETYGDTVCVAGLYLPPMGRGLPEPIRLYPVPFRYFQEEGFGKYDIRRFNVRRNPKDSRAESRRITLDGNTELVRKVASWKRRAAIVGSSHTTTMCALNSAARADGNATSLGLVPIGEATRLDIAPTEPLTAEEQERRERAAAQLELDLFGKKPVVKPILRPPPLSAKLRYRCTDSHCNGHTQGILDWELTAMQFREQREGTSLDEIERRLRKNFFETPFGADRAPMVFVGNQANPQRRSTFSVLSIFYPRRIDMPPAVAPLF